MTQPRIEIYTTRSCPFCHRAKALLGEKGVSYEETDVADPELRAAMTQRAGRRSVPQIFIGGTHVGGCDDLYALDAAGKLDPMLQGAA
jgi:glutaredoxin 3